MADTPLSSERVEEIRKLVDECRTIRSDAGLEAVEIDGTPIARGMTIAANRPKLARVIDHHHHYVRWANETLLDLLADHDPLVRENAELRKKIAFGVGWLGAMLERRQYENDTELHEFRDELSAALTSGPSNAS